MLDPHQVFKDLYKPKDIQAIPPFWTVWSLPEDSPYINGHFPGLPVFPAIGIVDATLHFIRGIIRNPRAEILKVDSAKFLSPIVPNTPVRLQVAPAGNRQWDAVWTEVRGKGKELAELRLLLNAEQ